MKQRSIAVVGGGAWGTALAIHAAGCGHEVRLWLFEEELVEHMRAHRTNPVYLPGVPVPESVTPEVDLAESLSGAELVLAVVPSAFARSIYRRVAKLLPEGVPVLVATKGIEERSLALPLAVAGDELGPTTLCAVLSGPSFAPELAAGKPTAVVVSGHDEALLADLQTALSSPTLRLYANTDPVGVQVAGALKNVMAIAAGVADSLELGSNTQAALITRGLAEITRLGCRLGAKAETFSGLAGIGDLVLTCTGPLSRNRRVGQRLGRGERLTDILAATRSVAEGVGTTRSSRDLARREGVEMPIVEELHRILFEEGDPRKALGRLMSRPLAFEARAADRTP